MNVRDGPASAPGIRHLATVAGLAAYLVAGWVILSHLGSGGEVMPTPSARGEDRAAWVTITIAVVDGPVQNCVTSADRAASDTILIAASQASKLIDDLGCWTADEARGTQ
jgi:hypothetical protein